MTTQCPYCSPNIKGQHRPGCPNETVEYKTRAEAEPMSLYLESVALQQIVKLLGTIDNRLASIEARIMQWIPAEKESG